MPPLEPIARDCGYEIAKRDREILFYHRGTQKAGILVWLFAGISGFLSLHGVLWLVLSQTDPKFSGMNPAIWIGLLIAGIFIGYLAVRFYRRYAELRDRSLDEFTPQLRIDLIEGFAFDAQGKAVCKLGDIRLTSGIDWFDSTKGLMRLLTLRWQGGRLRIFKTGKGNVAKAVAKHLGDLGIPAK